MEYLISPSNRHIHTLKLNLPIKEPMHTPRPKNYTPKLISFAHPSAKISSKKRSLINNKFIPYLDSYNMCSLFPKGFKYNIAQLFIKDKLNKTPKSIYKTLIKSKSCFNYYPLKRKEKTKNISPIPRQYDIRKNKMLQIKRAVSSFIMHNKLNSCPGNDKKFNNTFKIGSHKITYFKDDNNNIENKINPEYGVNIHKEFIEKEGKKNSVSKKTQTLEEIVEEDSNQYNHTDKKFYQKNSPSTTIGKTKVFNPLSPKEDLEIPCVEDYDNRNNYIPILKKKEQPRNRIQTAKKRFLIGLDKSIPGTRKNNFIGNESPLSSIGFKNKMIKNQSNPFGSTNYNLEKTDIFKNNYRTWKIGTEPIIKSPNSCKNISGSEANTTKSYRNIRLKSGFPKQKRENLTVIKFPEN